MDNPLCHLPKKHKEFADAKTKKHRKLGNMADPCAKKQSLMGTIMGTNSMLACPNLVVPTPVPHQDALQLLQLQAAAAAGFAA